MEQMGDKDFGKGSEGEFALANSPASPHDWQRGDELSDAESDDISTILSGNKAITGKAVYSANQASRNSDQNSAHELLNQKQHDAEEQEAREMMHLSAWNAERTIVGGVEMTNEDAQKARQHIIDHEDEYAHRAVIEGRINADEEEEYKRNNRRSGPFKAQERRRDHRVRRGLSGCSASGSAIQSIGVRRSTAREQSGPQDRPALTHRFDDGRWSMTGPFLP
jgi:hypothetical protein